MEELEDLKHRKRTKLFQRIVISTNTLLGRWFTASQSSVEMLGKTDAAVEAVIKETESAVVRIADSFRAIVKKTRRQTESATGLLKSHELTGESKDPAHLSLRDFAQLYETQLDLVTDELGHYARLSEGMVALQSKIRADATAMDDVMSEMYAMSSRLSKIFIDASASVLNENAVPLAFTAMTDRVRAISGESHELTRKARKHLDSIRDEVSAATKQIREVSDLSRAAANRAREEVAKLNAGLLAKDGEIEATLGDIKLLGGEIQKDINEIIFAMQFQDMQQQKLERIRTANLGPVSNSLASITHETRAFMFRDLYRAIVAYSESSMPLKKEQATPAEPKAETIPSAEQSADKAREQNKLELF